MAKGIEAGSELNLDCYQLVTSTPIELCIPESHKYGHEQLYICFFVVWKYQPSHMIGHLIEANMSYCCSRVIPHEINQEKAKMFSIPSDFDKKNWHTYWDFYEFKMGPRCKMLDM